MKRPDLQTNAGILLLCLYTSSGLSADETEPPTLELLEYLGGWEESADGKPVDPMTLYDEELDETVPGGNPPETANKL